MDRCNYIARGRRGAVGDLVLEVGNVGQTTAPDGPGRNRDRGSETVDILLVGWGEAVCEDHALPEVDDLQLIPVEAGAEIDVEFHAEPSNASFHQIVDGELVPAEPVVPDEPGVYVFETGGDWPQGDSRYVFGVEVKE